MAALKCRPGDLAYISSMHPAAGLNGHVVKLKNEPPIVMGGAAYWQLEDSIKTIVPVPCRTMSGRIYEPGDQICVDCVADSVLTPIRPQSDGEVDEMVRLVGAAPKTLTEVRDVTS